MGKKNNNNTRQKAPEQKTKSYGSYKLRNDFFQDKRKIFILFFLLVMLFYGNSIPNKYSLDDIYVTNNDQVKKGFRALPEIITGLYASHEMQPEQKISFGYRPVVKATFAIEYGIFGENPHISHLINVILYLITIWMVYQLLVLLFGNLHPLFPLIAALLFLAHPTHTEVVTSLKNRDELLSFLFSLISLELFRKWTINNHVLNLVGGFLIYFLAVLSKMSAIVFIVLIPLILYFLPDVKPKKLVWIFLLLAIAFLMTKFIPRLYLPHRVRPRLFVENPMIYMTFWERIPTAFYILLFYLKLVFLPFPLRFYYGVDMIPVCDWKEPLVWLSVFIHIGLVYLVIRYFRTKTWLSLGILIYIICISMYTNLVQLLMGIVADRFLYSPSLGFSIVLTGIIYLLSSSRPETKILPKFCRQKIVLLSVLLISAGMVKSIARNNDWKNVETLVKHDIKYLDRSARANFIYADLLIRDVMKEAATGNKARAREILNEAISHLEKAIENYPDYFLAWGMMGKLYYKFYLDSEKAKNCFQKCIQINPNYADAYSDLAFLYFKEKDYLQAEKYYLQAIKLLPGYKPYMLDLAEVYLQSGQKEKYDELYTRINNNKKSVTNPNLLPF